MTEKPKLKTIEGKRGKPNQFVIQELENLLKLAKSGDLNSFVLAGVNSDGSTLHTRVMPSDVNDLIPLRGILAYQANIVDVYMFENIYCEESDEY